ncbi:MAG: glycoside hydrolase family 18 [Bacillota bacterium]|nr:glycoside hydrolase family 18 [Bacillota bacterium]
MNVKNIVVLSLVLFLSTGFFSQDALAAEPQLAEPILAGYYTAWSAYSGYTPEHIQASKLTHISYAFAEIGPDLRVRMGYPDKDPENFKLLQQLKQKNPQLKTLISIGGWTWSGRFSDAALTEKNRQVFAESCITFMKQFGFDGIDLDWEYPVAGGLTSNKTRPDDKKNFTLLLKTLREALDQQGAADEKQYLLTIAGGAGTSYIKNTELSLIHKYLDFAVIMTYDFHGPWDKYTDFHSPLYISGKSSPQDQASFDTGVNGWINASFPAEKLVAGIPFYGYHYSTTGSRNDGLYQTFSKAKALSYKKITEDYVTNPDYRRFFHPQAKVPWLWNGSDFISYEDKESIFHKLQYIKSKRLAGAMIWELRHDKNGDLLNALQEGFK